MSSRHETAVGHDRLGHAGRLVAVPGLIVLCGCGSEPTGAGSSVSTVTVTLGASSIVVGATTPATATLRDAQGTIVTGHEVAWSSTNAAIASVSQAGVVTAASAGGPVTIAARSEGVSGTARVTVAPVPEVFTLEERVSGSILSVDASYGGPDTRWRIDHHELVTQFRASHGDIGGVDFMIVLPMKPLVSHYAFVANRSILGIGVCTACQYDVAPDIKMFAVVDFHEIWFQATSVGFDPDIYFPGLMHALLHEIGHYWLAYIEAFTAGDGGHWPTNLDLFSGDATVGDPMGYSHWIVNGGEETCVTVGDPALTLRFSDLSLYLMGFLPASSVAPINEHVFAPKAGDDRYNVYGPFCDEPHTFTSERTVTIEDIVALNGVRVPSSVEAQRDFQAVFLIVAAKGDQTPHGFVEYVKSYRTALPGTWSQATGGASTMHVAFGPP